MGSQRSVVKFDHGFATSSERQLAKNSSNCSLQGRKEKMLALFEYDHRKKVYRCKETKIIVSPSYVFEVIANGINRI